MTRPTKASGLDRLPTIPVTWSRSKLGYEAVVKARLGWKGLKAEEYVEDGYALLSTPNIKGREIDFKNVNFITRERYVESPEIMVREGDVLLTKDGFTLGTTNVVRVLPRPTTLNGSIALVRPKESLHSVFLYYLFASDFFQYLVHLMKDGMDILHLFQADLRQFDVLLPPVKEQVEIAAYLDRKTAAIDALIAKKERLIELLQEKRQALITRAVTKGLDPRVPMKESGLGWMGSIPTHWEIKRLKHLTRQMTVGIVITPSKYYVEEGVPCPRSFNVKPGRVDTTDLAFISPESNRLLSKSIIREGDLVAVRTGQPGTTAVVPRWLDGGNCIDLIIVRRSPNFSSAYLCHFMNSALAQHQYGAGSEGALQQHFNVETASNLLVPTPPVDEQAKIAARLAAALEQADRLLAAVQAHIEKLREYRQALITSAVTGKIDVSTEAA